MYIVVWSCSIDRQSLWQTHSNRSFRKVRPGARLFVWQTVWSSTVFIDYWQRLITTRPIIATGCFCNFTTHFMVLWMTSDLDSWHTRRPKDDFPTWRPSSWLIDFMSGAINSTVTLSLIHKCVAAWHSGMCIWDSFALIIKLISLAPFSLFSRLFKCIFFSTIYIL